MQSHRDNLESLVYIYVVVAYLGRTSSRGTPLTSMEHPFLRRRSPQAKPFAKAYLHPSSLLHNISNRLALMRSCSMTTSMLSSCNALLTVPTMLCLTPLPYHLHLANLPPLLSAPHHAVAKCKLNFFIIQPSLMARMRCTGYVHLDTQQTFR